MTNTLEVMLIKIGIVFTAGIVFYSCNKDVSVSPPDSLPPDGYLYVDSNPIGFQIYLNNIARGRYTPDSLTWLTTGTYMITLKKELFRDTSITVQVVEGKKSSVFIDYYNNSSVWGKIYCSTYPANAEISLNDSSTGQVTPYTFTLVPGHYNFNFHLKNHRDAAVRTTLNSGSTISAKAVLVDTSLWTDYTTSNSKLPSNSLTCIAIGKGNIIYAGTSDAGFFSFAESKDYWIPYHNTLSSTINCITFDNNGVLYAGTKGGMVTLFLSSFKEYGPSNSSMADYNIHSIAVDNEADCYIGTDKGITVFNGSTYTNSSFTAGGANITPVVNAISIDINGNIWAGLYSYGIAENTSSSSWTVYSSSKTSLINNYITTLTSSASGEVWAGFTRQGAYGNGLSYFNGSGWNNVYPIPSSSSAKSIYIDNNNIKWVGTDEGLVMFSTPSNSTTFNYDNTGLNINNIKGVAGDSYGNIWIATDSGLYKYKGNHY